MRKTYTASVLHGAKDLRLEQREIERPRSGEIQVEIRATGLCGSDLHYFTHYRNGDIHVQEPLTLGHESSGVVLDVGPDVELFHVGDRVALEVGISCGSCTRCHEGRYNLCRTMRFRSSGRGIPHCQGTLQQRINHPATLCYKLPANLSFLSGALIEPLSVAIHATRRAQLKTLSRPSVLIFGAGPVGLLCAAVCKVSGAARIQIADIQHDRVQFAITHNYATGGMVISEKTSMSVEEELAFAKATAIEACGLPSKTFAGFDVVFECTGAETCTQAAIYATREGGKVILVGMGNPTQTIPLSAAAVREVDILGSFRYANTYPEAIELMASKESALPDLTQLVTHVTHGLSELEVAFHNACETHDKAGKLVVKVMVLDDGTG